MKDNNGKENSGKRTRRKRVTEEQTLERVRNNQRRHRERRRDYISTLEAKVQELEAALADARAEIARVRAVGVSAQGSFPSMKVVVEPSFPEPSFSDAFLPSTSEASTRHPTSASEMAVGTVTASDGTVEPQPVPATLWNPLDDRNSVYAYPSDVSSSLVPSFPDPPLGQSSLPTQGQSSLPTQNPSHALTPTQNPYPFTPSQSYPFTVPIPSPRATSLTPLPTWNLLGNLDDLSFSLPPNTIAIHCCADMLRTDPLAQRNGTPDAFADDRLVELGDEEEEEDGISGKIAACCVGGREKAPVRALEEGTENHDPKRDQEKKKHLCLLGSRCCSDDLPKTSSLSTLSSRSASPSLVAASSGLPDDEITTSCAQAVLLIAQQNVKGVSTQFIEQWLWDGFFRSRTGSGCRVHNAPLFSLLAFISE